MREAWSTYGFSSPSWAVEFDGGTVVDAAGAVVRGDDGEGGMFVDGSPGTS